MSRRITRLALTALPLLLAGCVFVQPKPDGTVSFSLTPPSQTSTAAVSSATAPAATDANASRPAAAPSGPAQPGHELVSGAWKAVVESTARPASLPDGSKPRGGKRFLVVNVAIRNVGSGAALVVRPSQFRLAARGGDIKPYPTSLAAFNAQGVRPINVGMGGYTSFVYEVPAGDGVYTFVLTPGSGGAGAMSWMVP